MPSGTFISRENVPKKPAPWEIPNSRIVRLDPKCFVGSSSQDHLGRNNSKSENSFSNFWPWVMLTRTISATFNYFSAPWEIPKLKIGRFDTQFFVGSSSQDHVRRNKSRPENIFLTFYIVSCLVGYFTLNLAIIQLNTFSAKDFFEN